MDILYQTTFERTQSLGDVIVAVSATRFDEESYTRQVERAKAAGLMRESHADRFIHFDRINRHDIDFVSTDLLAPDDCGQGTLLAEYTADDFALPPSADGGAIRLGEGCSVAPCGRCPPCPSAPSIWNWRPKAMPASSSAARPFTVRLPVGRRIRHQVLLYDTTPAVRITALGEGLSVSSLRVRLVGFPQ